MKGLNRYITGSDAAAAAERAKLLRQRDLDYVRSKFPGDEITLDQLYGGGSFSTAAQQEGCEMRCPGEEQCRYGRVMRTIEKGWLFGMPIYEVSITNCSVARERAEKLRVGQMIQASRIPQKLLEATFDAYIPRSGAQRAAKMIAMHCAEGGDGLQLMGEPGTGKTHLAVAAVLRAIQLGRTAIYVPVVDLLDEIREKTRSDKIGIYLQTLRDVDLLAIDDLGMQKNTDWVGEKLYQIVNDRYVDKKQIIVTTNARNIDELSYMIGTSGRQIASRLSEMTASVIMDGADIRPAIRAARGAAVGAAKSA